MTPQEPAVGIMKMGDYGNATFYKVECSCGDSDDEIIFEVENDDGQIIVNTYFKPKSAYWQRLVKNHGNFENSFLWSIDYSIRSLINSIYHRLQVTCEVWKNGYVSVQQTTIMSEQQALNYGTTLINTISDFKEKNKAEK